MYLQAGTAADTSITELRKETDIGAGTLRFVTFAVLR